MAADLKGAITALDFGDRRIGVARCDPTRTVVTPVTVLERRSCEYDRTRLEAIIADQESVLLVVGLPLNMDGTEGPQAKKVRSEATYLLGRRVEPVIFHDERLTTFQADQLKMDGGMASEGDALAAAVLLEDYMASEEVCL